MSDGVHTNTLVSIVFGVKINKRVINRLVSILGESGIEVNNFVKHIKLNTTGYSHSLNNSFIHTLFAIRYLFKYQVSSSSQIRNGITLENINRWVDALFAEEDEPESIQDPMVTDTENANNDNVEDIEVIGDWTDDKWQEELSNNNLVGNLMKFKIL